MWGDVYAAAAIDVNAFVVGQLCHLLISKRWRAMKCSGLFAAQCG